MLNKFETACIIYRFKDGEKLEPSSRIRLEWDPDTRIASVLLKRLHILDTGEYECIVYGENGSYSTKTTLHVKGTFDTFLN